MGILEIATFSVNAAKLAQQFGAHRLELCMDYQAGGITPSELELIEIKKFLTIPAFVMIRPRGGNFCYDTDEINVIFKQLEMVKSMGFEGIVTGVLNQNSEVDTSLLCEIISAATPMDVIFHRAFDLTPVPEKAIIQLIECGVHRILSSKWKDDGIDKAIQLKSLAQNNIIYMPGGGIRSSNISTLLNAGFQELHSAAIINQEEIPDEKEIISMLGEIKKYA